MASEKMRNIKFLFVFVKKADVQKKKVVKHIKFGFIFQLNFIFVEFFSKIFGRD